jgi:hypothetical protein
MYDVDQETGWPVIFIGLAGFNRLRAGSSIRRLWMFDNEIDWVKRISSALCRANPP